MPGPPDGLTDGARRAALDKARKDVGAAREDVARLALDAERVPPAEGQPLATALGEAVRALDAAEEHIAVAALQARRVAAAKEASMTRPNARRMPLTTDKDWESVHRSPEPK